jgi:hypothetical protein
MIYQSREIEARRTSEAVLVDGAQEGEEVDSVVRVVVEVVLDHSERRLEHVVQYARHVGGHRRLCRRSVCGVAYGHSHVYTNRYTYRYRHK